MPAGKVITAATALDIRVLLPKDAMWVVVE
jgi:hypothetical protein